MKSKPIVTKDNVEKHIDETRLDSNQRAKSMLEYEQMLMQFIHQEFNDTLKGDI